MHLTRNKREKCVMARIMLQKRLHQANFTLRQYRTWTNAKEAAEEWVRLKLAELPPSSSLKGRKTKRNKTGIVGVHFKVDPRPPGSDREDYYYYVASWLNDRGERITIRFSWNKFGKRQARALARIARDHETTDRRFIYSAYRRKTGKSVALNAGR